MNQKYVSTGIVCLLFACSLFLRVNEIARPFWADEQISINTLNANIVTNPLYTGITTNLPLYFWCISVINLIFGPMNLMYLRLFGVVANLLNGLILFQWFRTLTGKTAAVALLSLFLFAPIQIHYAAELRPYVLSELLASALIILIYSLTTHDNKPGKKTWVAINVISVLGFLTHYSFYIFYLAVLVYVAAKSRSFKILSKIAFFPALVALIVAASYFSNPLFNDSLQGLELKRTNVSPLSRVISLESLNRVKEVVANYYYYGLYYYRMDSWPQLIGKKLFFVLALLSVWLIIRAKRPDVRRAGLMILVLLFTTLALALVGEKLGYYPFGGRHIMPFSFLLYIVICLGLGEIAHKYKSGKLVLLVVITPVVVAFILFQSCSQIYRTRYTGTGDPQGDIFRYCLTTSYTHLRGGEYISLTTLSRSLKALTRLAPL